MEYFFSWGFVVDRDVGSCVGGEINIEWVGKYFVEVFLCLVKISMWDFFNLIKMKLENSLRKIVVEVGEGK